jgi:hypothetical protein
LRHISRRWKRAIGRRVVIRAVLLALAAAVAVATLPAGG